MAVPLALAALIVAQENPQLDNILTANTTLTSSRVALKQINDATVYAAAVCQTNCTQLTQNITVIISPGAYVGPVSFTQLCQISDVNCAIKSLVDQGIKKSLLDIEQNNFEKKVSSGSLFGLTPQMIASNTSLDVSLSNNVYQLISSSCIFESNQVLSNNYVYVGTGATTGAISFAQSSEISSTDCAIDVIAKNNSYQVDKSTKSTPLFVLLIIGIVAILLLGIVFLIVFLVINSNKKSKNKYRLLDKKTYERIENLPRQTYAPPVIFQ
jgi:hypothetical protein